MCFLSHNGEYEITKWKLKCSHRFELQTFPIRSYSHGSNFWNGYHSTEPHAKLAKYWTWKNGYHSIQENDTHTHTQLSSVQNPSIHYTGLIIGILQHWHLDQSTFHPPPMLRCYHATGCRGPFLGLDLTWAIEALLRCGAGKTDFCGLCGLAWGWRRLWWLEVWSASPSKEPNTYCWLPPLHV